VQTHSIFCGLVGFDQAVLLGKHNQSSLCSYRASIQFGVYHAYARETILQFDILVSGTHSASGTLSPHQQQRRAAGA
jgi:hypothetical protein